MSGEVVIADVALVSLVGSIVTLLFRTSGSVNKALIETGVCKSDVVKPESETQFLRDQSVRADERMASITVQLSKLDKIDTLALTAIVERLSRRSASGDDP